jgi:HD-GYP domain-containing protein (c-di-GMP phosphodiesterase class II)
MFRPRLVLTAIAATLVVVLLVLVADRSISALDLRVYDALLRASGGGPPSASVAIVAIDDQSLTAVGQWPWPRDVMATLADRLRALGAKAVAFDMLFSEGDRLGRQEPAGALAANDAALAQSLQRGGTVVGYAMTFEGAPGSAAPCVLHPLPIATLTEVGEAPPAGRLFQATGSVCALPELARSAGASGFLNVGVDSDGTLRRLPLIMAYDGQIYPSFALAAVLAASPGELSIAARRDRPLQLTLGGRPVPLGERGTLLLRFRDGAHPFPHIPAVDVLDGRVAPGVLDGRIVFVGATALGVRDVVSTPLDRQYPGIQVHATAAENLLQATHIAPVPYHGAMEVLATVAFGLGAAVAVGGLGCGLGAGATVLALTAFWTCCGLLLSWWHVYLSPIAPTMSATATLGAVALAGIRIERLRADDEQRRRRQAHEFLVKSLTSLMEMRDPSTGRHSRRTQGYSRLLAQRLAHTPEFHRYLTPDRIEFMSLLAPLHDIGKVGIRDAVLNKTSRLTEDEMNEMRQHPVYGYETISKTQRQVGVDSAHDEAILQLAKDIVYTHHERWDGTGYPRGLRDHEIPVAGRIMALVDVYDALVEPRPYRRRMPHDEAVALIVAGSGTQFDPDVVQAFLTVSPDFQELGTRLRETPLHPASV